MCSYRLFSCGFGFGNVAVLFCDLVQDHGEAGDGSKQGTKYLAVESVLAGESRDFCDLGLSEDLAIHECGLDGEDVVHLLGVVIDDAERSDGVAGAGCERSGTVEDTIHFLQTAVVKSKAGEGILDDGVFKAYSDPNVIQKAFPSGFSTSNMCYILAVAGS